MKIVVTGGAGFIGSHLVEMLIEEGYQVYVLDNMVSGSKYNVHSQAVVYCVDICSREAKELILQINPDVVCHVAAQADVSCSILEPQCDANVNIMGTINILEACKEASVKKIIFSSTSAVYGNTNNLLIKEDQLPRPISCYGLSKWTAESYIQLFCQLYGISFTILRYANVYGPRQSPKGEGGVIAVFIDRMIKRKALTIHGDGEQTRDYVYVKDVAKANVAAIEKGDQEILHVSTSHKTSVNQLVNMLEQIQGKNISTVYTEARKGDIKHSCLDNTKAKTCLQWEPKIKIFEGLLKTYEFHKK